MTIEQLGGYFGFARPETERVVNDLSARDLIIVDTNLLSLSAHASALFKASADEEPRLIEQEQRTENVWIDLVSRSLVPRPRQTPQRNLIDVPPHQDATDIPADFARRAFEENFRDYVSRILALREPDRVSLHSIAGVEPDRYGSIAVSGRKVIQQGDRSPRLIFEGAGDATPQFQELLRSLSTEYGRLNQPGALSTSLDDFQRLTGVNLRPFVSTAQQFDLWRWLLEPPEVLGGYRSWFVGASYLEESIKRVTDRLESVDAAKLKPHIRWLRPAGTSWGMTMDLTSCVQRLRKAVGLPDSPRTTGTTLFVPRTVAQTSRRHFRRLFETGVEVPSRLGSNLELISVGSVVALVLVHVPIDRRDTAPIGLVTDQPLFIERVEKVFTGQFTELWNTKASKKQAAGESIEAGSESIT